MEKEKFDEKDKNNLKGISKALYIIAKICRIFTIIGIVGMGILMLFIPVFMNKVEIKDNTIRIDGVEETLKLEDLKVENKEAKEIIEKVEEFFDKNSKGKITVFIEVVILFVVAEMIIYVFVFKYLEKVFKNINTEDTPFTFTNANNLMKTAWALVIVIGLGLVSGIAIDLMFNADINSGIDLPSVFEALFIFAMAYVFKYGASLGQVKETKKLKKSKKE